MGFTKLQAQVLRKTSYLLVFVVFCSALYLWLNITWRYRPILRNEFTVFSVPLSILILGMLVSVAILLLPEFITSLLNNGYRERSWWGERFLGFPFRWEVITLGVILLTTLVTVPVFFLLNQFLDFNPVETHIINANQADEITNDINVPSGRRSVWMTTSCYLRVPDWKNSQKEDKLDLPINCSFSSSYEFIEHIIVTTKPGFFGYEWIVDIEQVILGKSYSIY